MSENSEATQPGADASDEDALAAMFGDEEQTEQAQEQVEEPEIEVEEELEPEVSDDDPEIELKIDGKTEKVKLSQLKADAQKFKAANQRFEEAAAIRKEAEELKTRIPEQEKQLNQVLTHFIQQSQAMMQSQQPNWEQLLTDNPQEYLRVRHQWEQRQTELLQAQQAKELLDQRESEAKKASNQQRIDSERSKLAEMLPHWKDPQKAAEEANAIGDYLKKQGIPADMLEGLDKAEVVVIARKAMLYDQAIARKQQAQNTVKQAPTVEKSGVSRQATPKNDMAKARATKAFNANPSIDTLADLF